jgi:hypothetical protein
MHGSLSTVNVKPVVAQPTLQHCRHGTQGQARQDGHEGGSAEGQENCEGDGCGDDTEKEDSEGEVLVSSVAIG